MSLWHITSYEPLLQREWTLVAFVPDGAAWDTPASAGILLADQGREATSLYRKYAMEKELAAKGMAGLCVPGWVLEHPSAEELIGTSLPKWFASMFPVKVDFLWGDGGSAEVMKQLNIPLEIKNG